MPRAVRFDHYGPVDVLNVVEVDRPTPAAGQVLVEVVSAGINPGEIWIREGLLHARWPATFPSGQGSDFAGRVVGIGAGVQSVQVGDNVLGFTDERASHADFVVVPVGQVTAKPDALSWDQAGALKVAGTTAYATVHAVSPKAGETLAVSGATGGVGSLTVQLGRRTGAQVIGIASATNSDWLRSLGITPVTYGDGLADRLRAAAPNGIDAFIDTFGDGYVEIALHLGVRPERIDTIVDAVAAQDLGVQTVGGATASTAPVLAELAELLATGELTMPIARSYPIENVREAYTELAKRHTRGKIVLRMR
jgi:NADPH:quinone reductase-like Zn-dependent oxidoreductase